ncbi:MAG: hypothetical protein MK101_11660 [Phycisphaerales bacterium]|nr:hypothetical protein [Phycisphaerales bacterium]
MICRAMLLVLLCVASCAQPRIHVDDPIAGVPDDFSVDLTILVNPSGEKSHERTSRLIVLADGQLFFDAIPGRGPNTKPGWVRTLDREEMARLWDAALRAGLGDATKADETADLRRARMPEAGGSVWLVALTADGDRWNFLRSWGAGTEPDAALRMFTREALALAWAPDTLSERPLVEPRRWDFGPDPWGDWAAATTESP